MVSQNPNCPLTVSQNPNCPLTVSQNPNCPLMVSQNPNCPLMVSLSNHDPDRKEVLRQAQDERIKSIFAMWTATEDVLPHIAIGAGILGTGGGGNPYVGQLRAR